MKKTLAIVLAAVILGGGCVSKNRPIAEPVSESPAAGATPSAPQPAADSQDNKTNDQYVGSRGAVQDVWGWRVQIFASGTLENARKVAEEARWKFGDQQVYVADLDPYYKVQVGNNLTRQEADRLKKRAQGLGYQGAFIVEVNLAE
jgi:hypothetical protein